MKYFPSLKTLLVLLMLPGSAAIAQLVGDNTFLPGPASFLEVGIAPNGSLGSTRNAPSGYFSHASPCIHLL